MMCSPTPVRRGALRTTGGRGERTTCSRSSVGGALVRVEFSAVQVIRKSLSTHGGVGLTSNGATISENDRGGTTNSYLIPLDAKPW